MSRRVNLSATIPYLSIESTKFQGAHYERVNRGFGDLVAMAEVSVLTSPQVIVEGGIKFATGSVDNTDDLDQRICDILALGSGTTDLLLGANLWIPLKKILHLDLTAGFRHRFVGGQNKWGYSFGDQTTFFSHLSRRFLSDGRLGLKIQGFHTEPDTWLGNRVPERGATMLYIGPTVAWNLGSKLTVGGFYRFPAVTDLEGSQMVAPSIFGLELSSDISDAMNALMSSLGGE